MYMLRYSNLICPVCVGLVGFENIHHTYIFFHLLQLAGKVPLTGKQVISLEKITHAMVYVYPVSAAKGRTYGSLYPCVVSAAR